MARGELALALGRTDEALRLLEEGSRLLGEDAAGGPPAPSLSEVFIAAESSARILADAGELEKARDALKAAVAARGAAFGPPLCLWVRCAQRLADVERRLGNTQASEELDRQLRALLADADPDFRLVSDWTSTLPATSRPGRRAQQRSPNR